MSESEATAPAVPSPKIRRYPKDFQQDAVCLVTEEKYTFKAAAQAVGVSEKSLRDWHKNSPRRRCRVVIRATSREQASAKRAQASRDGTRRIKKSCAK